MTKGLITAIGLVVSLGVVALGFFLVALPILTQALAVDSQTQTVATANDLYQVQVDSLQQQEDNLDEINSDVATLRAQIPASGQFDDVFEVVGRAAEASSVSIVSITAGETATFVVRTGEEEDTSDAAAPVEAAPAPSPSTSTDTTATDPIPVAPAAGRQQVDFVINVTAPDMDRATAFLDALRSGPRLLNSVRAASSTGDGGVAMQVSVLTYVDGEG